MNALNTLTEKKLRIAEMHLRNACASMNKLIEQYGPCALKIESYNPFETLVNSIISQQLSAKASYTIKMRVYDIVKSITLTSFLTASNDNLRQAGLSSMKIHYIFELARRVDAGEIDFEVMKKMSDDDIVALLMKLPGIGQWTAEMFLIFGLHRQDVLSLGDAGLRRAAHLIFGETVQLEHIGQTWRPYRSVASWYLWRALD
jgi:DNA-3-methyladenine glycosylase II